MLVLLSLFFISFLAGSFVPLGSEAFVVGLQVQGENVFVILIVATIGNVLGGMSCYFISRKWGKDIAIRKLHLNNQKVLEWENKLTGKSEYMAILCWLPFVGEVIATSLGLVTHRWAMVTLFMTLGKGIRYAFILRILQAFQ